MKIALLLSQIPSALKHLVGLAEAVLPGATGAEKKEYVVTLLNEKFDLPILNEEQEAELFGFGFDRLVGFVKAG